MPTTDQRSDEQLMEAYRNGDADALQSLIRRYDRELLGFLTRLTGNHASAEDVFQETFLQIHISKADFDVQRRFRPWLFTIGANKARDYFRKHGRQAAMVDLSAPVRGGGDSSPTSDNRSALVDLLKIDLPSVDAALNESELRHKVRDIIDSMPLNLREILLLAYFQRLSYNHIAESLGIPLGTVKSRLHAAVAAFADRWYAATPSSSSNSHPATES